MADEFESQRLLSSSTPAYSSTALNTTQGHLSNLDLSHRLPTDSTGEAYDNVPTNKRRLGLASCIFLIFNRIIGTGIYATPSVILRASGSVGIAFLMWLTGALIAAAGAAVYVELGTTLPRSGGEKNYLEFIYRRPKFLITCAFSVYAVITGTAAANSVVFGECGAIYYVINTVYSMKSPDVIHSLGKQPARWNTRFVAWLCLTFCLLIHGVLLKWGIRLQNGLGMFKLVILSAIAIAGILSLLRVPGFAVREGYEVPRNFEWDKFWEGSGRGANAFVSGLYNVIWSFVGYSNANYALSEVKDPIRTIKRATPIALLGVTTMYLFINIAYFAVVAKDDILSSRRIVAALFFRNLFGPTTEKALSVFIALSTLGNLLSGQFSQGRVIQELGREGILPFGAFFASNKPFNAPLAGLFAQYTISCAVLFATPPGDAYLFMISTSSYCLAIINTLVSFGLLLLYTPSYKPFNWDPPFRAPKIVILIFFISNVFLVLVPFIPPGSDSRTYEHLPYWIHAMVSWSVSLIGIAYWYVKCIWLPRQNGYKLEREWVLQDDGVSRCVFRKVPVDTRVD